MKMYIAVLDEFPDYAVPSLVAHTVLGAHLKFSTIDSYGYPTYPEYAYWLEKSFKKVIISTNQEKFDTIAALNNVYIGYESSHLKGQNSCIVVCPRPSKHTPFILKSCKLWGLSNLKSMTYEKKSWHSTGWRKWA